MRKIFIFLFTLNASLAFAQTPDEYDHEMYCFQTNTMLLDHYILFNEGDNFSWVMNVNDYETGTWNKVPMEEQPDRWVVETLNIQDRLINSILIPKKMIADIVHLSNYKMKTINETSPPKETSWSIPCFIGSEIIKIWLEDKERREAAKASLLEEMYGNTGKE
jgi:hypothetical protein